MTQRIKIIRAVVIFTPQASTMKRLLLLLLVGLLSFSSVHAADSAGARAIKAVLTNQQEAWNRGDVDAFMQGYWPSDTLRFASGAEVTYGWKTTLERYKKRYPDKAAMGTLAFSDLDVTVLAPDAAVVFGRWELTRAKDKPHGLFTLIFRKTSEGWRIIHDHTSSE